MIICTLISQMSLNVKYGVWVSESIEALPSELPGYSIRSDRRQREKQSMSQTSYGTRGQSHHMLRSDEHGDVHFLSL